MTVQAQMIDKYRLISEIARRRGFFWGSFEIYGGLSGFLDLGPYGVALKKLLEDEWRSSFLRPHGFLEVSTPIITPSRVLEASGHVANFKDPMTECGNCHRRFRADQTIKEAARVETEGLTLEQLGSLIREKNVRCPECGGPLGDPEYFHTMFKTTIGPYSEDVAYGRPEAAQGVFINFRRLMEVSRERFPIGIAQIGTALRNEISPRQGPIRLREFTIMDFEFFFNPEDPEFHYIEEVGEDALRIVTEKLRKAGKEDTPVQVSVSDALKQGIIKTPWAAYFMALSTRFLAKLGIPTSNQRFFEKLPDERAHYSRQTFDHEIQLDRWGWVEVAGFAYRTDYDLKSHMQASGTDMRVFKPYENPVEKTKTVVRPIFEKLRQLYGNDAGKIGSLLSKTDPADLEGKHSVKIDGHTVPSECFELRLEKIKESGAKFLPHVIEPSFGVERLLYSTLEYSLKMREDRIILSIPPKMAPVQVAVFPLLGRDGLPEKAEEVNQTLAGEGLRTEYDESGSIGRRYARADEAGIPVGITVDYDSLKDDTATLRDRDTWQQVRRPIPRLPGIVRKIVENGFQTALSEN